MLNYQSVHFNTVSSMIATVRPMEFTKVLPRPGRKAQAELVSEAAFVVVLWSMIRRIFSIESLIVGKIPQMWGTPKSSNLLDS